MLFDLDERDWLSLPAGGVGCGGTEVLASARSAEGREVREVREVKEVGDGCILDGEAGSLRLRGRSGVLGLLCGMSNEKARFPNWTPSEFEVDGRPRLGSGDGTSNDRSMIAVMGGVLGNMGSCHSKWGAEMPSKTDEFRETMRPRGKENLA